MNKARVKKTVSAVELWFCGALLGLVPVIFALMGYLEEAPKFEKLRSEGITVQAEVLRKVNFTQSCEPSRKGITRTCRIREFHLRYLNAQGNNLDWRYGTVAVGQAVFDATQEGQAVSVVFLHEGPNDMQLSSDVENYSPIWYALLGISGGFSLLFCTIKAVQALRSNPKQKSHA